MFQITAIFCVTNLCLSEHFHYYSQMRHLDLYEINSYWFWIWCQLGPIFSIFIFRVTNYFRSSNGLAITNVSCSLIELGFECLQDLIPPLNYSVPIKLHFNQFLMMFVNSILAKYYCFKNCFSFSTKRNRNSLCLFFAKIDFMRYFSQ